MEVAFSVHICQSLQSLINNIPNLKVRKFALFLQQLKNVAIEVFKYEIELVILLDQLK